MLIAIALVSLALVVPAQAQTYGTIVGETIPAPGTGGMLLAGTTLEVIFWVELDDRGGADSGLSGMDLHVSWDPAQATLTNISDGELWILGAYAADNDVNLDNDGDWGADYYSGDPPGPAVQYKILDLGTDTYIGDIPGVDGVAGTNLWTNQFQITPAVGSVFLEGYQSTPADFSIGSAGSPYPFAHLAFEINQDLTASGLCLNLVIDTLGQLNSPINTVDRILFAPPMVGCGNFSRNQAVSIAGGEINEWDWAAGIIPEPSVFLLAGLGLLALLRRRR
jgi:hypothetical protein